LDIKFSLRVPHPIDEVFHPSAAESVIGKDTRFNGKPAKITDAYVEGGDLIVAIETEEGETNG
jgi:hypothetical protein